MRTIAVAAALAAAFASGLALGPRISASPSRASERSITVHDRAIDLTRLADQLVEIRRELSRCAPAAGATATATAAAAPYADAPATGPAADDGAALASADEGRALLEHAVGTGVWTAESATALRRLMPSLGEAARGELLARLTTAINEGQLRLDDNRNIM